MILKHCKVFQEDKGFLDLDISIGDGKISTVGEVDGEDVIDLNGMYVTPGLIDAHSHLGMWEECIGEEGADGNEMTDPVTPNLKAIDGFNPMDIAVELAIKGGVTTVATGPGSTNIFGGQFSVIKLEGKVVDKMLLKDYVGAKVAFGENPKKYYGKQGKAPMTRMGVAGIMRETLNKAKDYMSRKELAKDDASKLPPYNEKFESLIKVLTRDVPLKVHAHRADDIATAIRIAKEFDVDITLDHCTEGHLIGDYIKECGYSVIVGPSFGFRTKVELVNKSFETPKKLMGLGIKTAIMTDHPVIPQEALILCAMMANKAGLSKDEALMSITCNPADILGVEDRIGRIKKGLDADLVIWDRHPLDFTARVMRVYIEGKIVFDRLDK